MYYIEQSTTRTISERREGFDTHILDQDSIVVASLPIDEEALPTVLVVAQNLEDEQPSNQSSREDAAFPSVRGHSRVALAILFGVLTLASVSIMTTYIVVSTRQKEMDPLPSSPSQDPFRFPDELPEDPEIRFQQMYDFLINNQVASPSELVLPTSPQTRALNWLAYQDTTIANGPQQSNFLQRYALITIAYSTGVELWRTTNPWTDNMQLHECTFEGIECDEAMEVVGMNMDGQRLTGTLPEEMGLLTSLTSLVLDRNKLEGSIPESLFQLTELDILHLYENSLDSTLSTGFGNLVNLRSLHLGSNAFAGDLPISALQKLTSLQAFILSNSNLDGDIWQAVVNWPFLEYLNLWNPSGPAPEIPSSIGRLFGMKELVAFGPGLPTEVGQLSNLQVLRFKPTTSEAHADEAKAMFLPTEIGRLGQLEILSMNGKGAYEGSLPTEIGRLTNLEVLEILTSRLTGTIPSELANLRKLRQLSLRNSEELVGTIPKEFGNLARSLDGTFVEGRLPSEFCVSGVQMSLHCSLISCDCCSAYYGESHCVRRS